MAHRRSVRDSEPIPLDRLIADDPFARDLDAADEPLADDSQGDDQGFEEPEEELESFGMHVIGGSGDEDSAAHVADEDLVAGEGFESDEREAEPAEVDEEGEGDEEERPRRDAALDPRGSERAAIATSDASSGAPSAIADHVGRLSDRAIQRTTGGNAFLRGRIYARRGAVVDLQAEGDRASARVLVRNGEIPYETSVKLDPTEGRLLSACTCPGFRGPTGHCKHVAALLVALRDRERPRVRPAASPTSTPATSGLMAGVTADGMALRTVSVGGRRRRARRRRRLVESGAPPVEIAPLRERESVLPPPRPLEARSVFDAWLPEEVRTRPLELEYRVAVRSASITVCPVQVATRQPVPIPDALLGPGTVALADRRLMRALARHLVRGQTTIAEIRGEDAAEVLSLLRGRRVLLEPALMELRFGEEPLRPRLELEPAGTDQVRVRVVFELRSGGTVRRFSLGNGAWFEGAPGWHVDSTEGMARPIAETVSPAWLVRLYRASSLLFPIGELPRVLTEHIPRVAAALSAELPDLSTVADVIDTTPRFVVRAVGDIIEARVRLQVRYGDHELAVPARGQPQPLVVLGAGGGAVSSRPRVIRRDVGAELVAVQRLLDEGLTPDESGEQFVANGEQAIRFWTEGMGRLPEDWERLVPDDLRAIRVRDESVTPRLRVSSGVDWFSLDLSFDAGGVAVGEDELRFALERGQRLVRLEDGTYAPIRSDEVGAVLARMAEIVATSGQGRKIPLSQAGRIQDLLRLVGRASVVPRARELFDRLSDVGTIEQVAKPRALRATLRDYQKRGFSWLVFLHQMGTGGVLADDMGLGKTLQAIALLLWARGQERTGPHRPALVVAPTSVVPNWQREIERFAPSLSVVVWQGPDRHERRSEIEEADVVLTSYALLRRDEETLSGFDFGYVVLDEAQHIKNPLSATARAAKRLRARHRLALTGTPIENRLAEFWSIVDFVSPGLLGELRTFEERYARPIDRGDTEAAERLRRIVAPFVLRRTKAQVAPELPAKIEQDMVVPLADEQQALYRQVLAEVRRSVLGEIDRAGIARAQIQILAALTRLRQVACDPRLLKLADGARWTADDSGKLSALRELLSECIGGGHRVLVFSQFVEMLQLIRAALDEDGVRYEYLDGSTKDRMERVQRFNEDESVHAFLISLKAGGTGLNLVGADTVIHFDPWWNPAVEDQATDRAHRIGQSKVVTVYRLIARGTVEEKILELSAKKRELMQTVLSAEGTGLRGLTREDVESLFAD
ncbi:MAG: SNF2-related protein [Myxococcales bacterium]|nr:SNF2-related protein [Myxococcales bacterium]